MYRRCSCIIGVYCLFPAFLCNYKSIVSIPTSNYCSSLSIYPNLFNIRVDFYIKLRGDDVKFPGTVAIAEDIAEDGTKRFNIILPSLPIPIFFLYIFLVALLFLLPLPGN